MYDQYTGWLWILLDVIAVVILGAVLIYGTMRWRKRRRDPALERERDRATVEAYRSESEPSR